MTSETGNKNLLHFLNAAAEQKQAQEPESVDTNVVSNTPSNRAVHESSSAVPTMQEENEV